MLSITAVGVVLMVSLLAPAALRPLLAKRGIIDVPNDRSSHSHRAIRGLGLGPLIAIVIGLIILGVGTSDPVESALVWAVMGVCASSGLLGWLEDARGLPVVARALVQLAIGIAGAAVIVAVVHGPWWTVPLFGLGIAAYMNVTNFMDGVNGISGLHGIVVGTTYALVGTVLGISWLTIAGLILAAAFAGFLPWNVVGRGMFLGDVGSYLLGGSIAGIAVAAIMDGAPALALIGPLTIYLADTGVTLVRRVVRGERWFEAHRSHTYQRLTDYGQSHLQVAVTVTFFSAVAAAVGFGSMGTSVPSSVLVVLGLLLIAGGYFLYVALRRRHYRSVSVADEEGVAK